jgi:peptidoglycan/xylan/chitin deacetylase (PgdA/CDA1 family)
MHAVCAATLPASTSGDTLNPKRSLPTLLVTFVLLAATAGTVSGCGRRPAPASAAQTGTATSGLSGSGTQTPSPSGGALQLPQIAPASTLEPPSFSAFEPLPSFTYHHVSPKITNSITITPATFEGELKTLANLGYHTVTARQVIDHQVNGTPLPSKPVMITFDDGWDTQYKLAWPLLKKYGMVATFFINPQPIASGYQAYMTRDMIVSLNAAGNDIESHTWRHLALTRTAKVTAAQFQQRNVSELTRANSWIVKVTGKQPVALCYPFGYYDLETVGLAKSVGYKAGFTVDEGVADARPWDAFQMKRFTITSAETPASFLRRLTSGPLPVTDIQPAPGTRVVGVDTTVSVNVSAIPPTLTGLKMVGGPSMSPMQIVERNGFRYAEARIHGGKIGFRALSMKATGPDGRVYYASWGIEIGDR